MGFAKFIFLVIILFSVGDSYAATYWYSSWVAAQTAGGCANSLGEYQNTNVCAYNGLYTRYTCGANYYQGCHYDFASCSVTGQTRDVNGICSCPAGQEVYLNQCVEVCPEGTQRLSDGSCSVPIPTCSELGVNPSDVVAKCKQMIPQEPVQCVNSDHTLFNLADCPTVQCADGSSVIYPAPCPVVECPDGFDLVDMGDGYGNSCIKPAPPNENDESCFFLSGSDEPLCVDPNNSKCQYLNGGYVCLEAKSEQPSGSTCYQSGGQLYCVTNQPEVKETTTETQNPDGTTTRTVDKESNIVGDKPSYTTQTCAADGTCQTVTKGGSESQRVLDLNEVNKNTAAIKGNTAKANEHLKDISDKLKEQGQFGGEGPGEGEELYTKTDKTFESLFTDFKSDIQTIPLYAAVNSAFVASFSGCNCPVWDTDVNLMGASFHIQFDQLCSEFVVDKVLPFVSSIIAILAALIAIKFAFL